MNTWIKEQLLQNREPDYQKFISIQLPGVENILGIRLPILRKIAKQLATENWQEYLKTAS